GAPRGPALLLALFAAGMAAFALLVHLPLHNETKFVFQIYLPLAILAAVALPSELAAFAARRGRLALAVALAALFAVPPLLTLAGEAFDPAGRTDASLHPAAGAAALY